MKAAIMLSNFAARSSLFSDAPRPHRAPIQPNIPPLGDAVPTSTPNWCALFICLYLFKWASWSQFRSRLTPADPWRERDGILSSLLNWCALSSARFLSFFFFMEDFRLGCIAGLFTLVVWGTLDCSPWKKSVHFCNCALKNAQRNVIQIPSSVLNIADKSARLGFNSR